jgi:O-antigen/teichoic acid export membrane protein
VTTPDVDLGVIDDTPATPAMGSARGRVIWTFADQALSSLTNAALAIVVAKAVSKDEFGAFSLALVTFAFTIGLGRSMIGDPYVVRFTEADPITRRRATSQATGAAISFGLLTGLIVATAGALLSGQARMAMLALALALPGLMLQETWRHTFFAAGRPAAATVNDAVWTVVQFVLLGLLLARGQDDVFLITLAWGVAALVAALFGIIQTGVVPSPLASMAWYRETRDLNVKMGIDFALNMGAVNLATYLIAGIVGLAATGALRAAQVLLGPLNLLFAGLSAFVLPVLSRTAATGRSLVKQASLASLAVGVIASSWVAILVFLPDSIGDQVLGKSWSGAQDVMIGSGIVSVAVAFVTGPALGLKALRRADQMLRVTFLQAPIMLGLGAYGGWRWGATGAAYGFAIAQVFGLLVCWFIFIRADSERRHWLDPAVTGALDTMPAPVRSAGDGSPQPARRRHRR